MDNILFAIDRLRRLSRLPIGLADDLTSPQQRMLAERAAREQFPVFEIRNGTSISGACTDQGGQTFLIGPAELDPEMNQQHHPLTTLPDFLTTLALLNQILNGQMVTEEHLMRQGAGDSTSAQIDTSDLLTYRLDQNEHEISHLSYSQEKQLINAIRDGNVQGMLCLLYTSPSPRDRG